MSLAGASQGVAPSPELAPAGGIGRQATSRGRHMPGTNAPSPPDVSEPGIVHWSYDPWRERPRVAIAAAAGALLLCALVVAAHEPFLVAVGLCLFCVSSFSPALTPVECRADAEGIARRSLFGWERRPWSAIRRIDDLPAGVLLSPYARRHWLDATRGWSLPMPAAARAQLRAFLRARWEGAHARA